jgi:hypothetical protein
MARPDPRSNFLVRENSILFIVLGVIFSIMFIISLTDIMAYDFVFIIPFKALYLTIIPAFIFLKKGLQKKKTIIMINRNGFYYFGELITSWPLFIDAVVTQDEKIFTLQDNFVLIIRYRNNEGKIFRSKIRLGNTQDKSEEEIIAAIRFFSSAENRL